MTADKPLDQNHAAVAPEAEPWLRFSEWARDVGDRVFCVVCAVASAVAMALVAAWVWAMPSLG